MRREDDWGNKRKRETQSTTRGCLSRSFRGKGGGGSKKRSSPPSLLGHYSVLLRALLVREPRSATWSDKSRPSRLRQLTTNGAQKPRLAGTGWAVSQSSVACATQGRQCLGMDDNLPSSTPGGELTVVTLSRPGVNSNPHSSVAAVAIGLRRRRAIS